MTPDLQTGVVMIKWPIFNSGAHHIFGMGKVRRFKFGVQIDIDECYRVPRATHYGSLTKEIFNVGGITDN